MNQEDQGSGSFSTLPLPHLFLSHPLPVCQKPESFHA